MALWTFIAPQNIVKVSMSDANERAEPCLTIAITNLTEWFEKTFLCSTLEHLVQENQLAMRVDEVLELLKRCCQREKELNGFYSLDVEFGMDKETATLLWKSSSSSFSFEFVCDRDDESSNRIRDDLIIPLLRGWAVLENIVSENPESGQVEDCLRRVTSSSIHVPDFHRPLCRQLLGCTSLQHDDEDASIMDADITGLKSPSPPNTTPNMNLTIDNSVVGRPCSENMPGGEALKQARDIKRQIARNKAPKIQRRI